MKFRVIRAQIHFSKSSLGQWKMLVGLIKKQFRRKCHLSTSWSSIDCRLVLFRYLAVSLCAFMATDTSMDCPIFCIDDGAFSKTHKPSRKQWKESFEGHASEQVIPVLDENHSSSCVNKFFKPQKSLESFTRSKNLFHKRRTCVGWRKKKRMNEEKCSIFTDRALNIAVNISRDRHTSCALEQ